jgi:hypothetical protein
MGRTAGFHPDKTLGQLGEEGQHVLGGTPWRRFEAVVTRKKRATSPVQPLFDGEKEAHLIRLACSQPPAGRRRWTLRLLADKLVELEIMDAVNFNTVGRTLKKTNLSLI